MKNTLIIVESPTKAKTIGQFLGKGYTVESSFGHVRDLPRSRFSIELENNFAPEYIIPIKARKRVTELKKKAAKAKEIILASDEDREGEAIAWHLKAVLLGAGKQAPKTKAGIEQMEKIQKTPFKRIVFHEITETAIANALANPRDINQPVVDAQQARRILDRIVGYKLSPFLWKKIAKGLSAGRVQSVALRLVVDRENEIRAFKPDEYWSITVQLKNNEDVFEARLVEVEKEKLEKLGIGTKESAEAIVANLQKAQYKIDSIETKEVRKNPPTPFTTSTLQQAASSRLHFSPKRTMMLAQNLYEHGHITYMRTDSVNLSQESTAAARAFLTAEFGKEYALENARSFKNKSKGAQEAHEAIRPTRTTKPENLAIKDAAARKLYDLIWSRFLASQMPQAIFQATKVSLTATFEDKVYGLRTNGNNLFFDGFLKVYTQSFEEASIPDLSTDDTLTAVTVTPSQHFTEPPPRYSEARLIKTLEEHGIGRPSTYVPIISVIQSRNYVRKDGGAFIPTEIGEMVNTMLTTHFPAIVDIDFTAKMETRLDEIAEGKEPWQKPIEDFYTPFELQLEKKYEEVAKVIEDEESEEKCEKCEKPMTIKFGRFGKFLACSGFPECKNAKNLKENEPAKIGMKCPTCSEGEIVEKRTRKGRRRQFWGCNKYPDCDFASWKNPLEENSDKSD